MCSCTLGPARAKWRCQKNAPRAPATHPSGGLPLQTWRGDGLAKVWPCLSTEAQRAATKG
eukprot:15420959-Alexandrium_andersonii.AAC.1